MTEQTRVDAVLTGVVRMILRNAARQLSGIDPELAAHLNDLAADYAGPYTEETE